MNKEDRLKRVNNSLRNLRVLHKNYAAILSDIESDLTALMRSSSLSPIKSLTAGLQESVGPLGEPINLAEIDPTSIPSARVIQDPKIAKYIVNKRIALVVGHWRLSQGANSYNRNTQEWQYWKTMTDDFAHRYNRKFTQVSDLAGSVAEGTPFKRVTVNLAFDVYYRDGTGVSSAHTDIEASDYEYDLILELHFNAFNGNVGGAEILVGEKLNSPAEWHFVKHLLSQWTALTGIRQRGVKTVKRGARGYFNVNNLAQNSNVKAPYLLLEPFFGDNKEDWNRAHKYNHNPLVTHFEIIADYLIKQQLDD